MADPAIKLPDLSDSWFKDVTKVPVPEAFPGPAPRILDGMPAPREWSLADSGLNVLMSPDDIKTIDLSGSAPPAR